MRAAAGPRASDGLVIKAYAGTTGVMLCFDIDEGKRKGLLGFAIQRTAVDADKAEWRKPAWLSGLLRFPETPRGTGEHASSVCPIQKFRWSDYRVFPGERYTYEVHPVYGQWDKPKLAAGLSVKVKTHGLDESDTAIFNRAAAASQAFSKKFARDDKKLKAAKAKGKKLKDVALSDEAMKWLSRGLLERLLQHLAAAKDKTYGLDIAIYEYHLEAVAEAVQAAHDRGVVVRLIHHSKSDKATTENKHLLKAHPLPNAEVAARKTSKIMHNKFAILHRIKNGKREPLSVLCGSTNWTLNGCYRQANVVHVTNDNGICKSYAELFNALLETAAKPAATKAWINANNAIPANPGVFAGFSPRTAETDIKAFVALIKGVKRDVLFSTAFDLKKEILEAFKGKMNDPILRLGVQNTKSEITGVHLDRSESFTAAALLPSGLEGWLKESLAGQKGNILIHTKMFVGDFTSDDPVIMSGSHNLSASASSGNDENYLILRGKTDLADIYGCEIMRIYDHYRFRYRTKTKTGAAKKRGPQLTPDDTWTERYFVKGSLHESDRLRFTGK